MSQLLDIVATFSLKPKLKADVMMDDAYKSIGNFLEREKTEKTEIKEM
jgi:hypothetical protein